MVNESTKVHNCRLESSLINLISLTFLKKKNLISLNNGKLYTVKPSNLILNKRSEVQSHLHLKLIDVLV